MTNKTVLSDEQHPDDIAVDLFADAMKEKLAKKRAEGRTGWQRMSAEDLSILLHQHIAKGDPLDVANIAMMLYQNGQSVLQSPEIQQLRADRNTLKGELKSLMQGYLNALENGRDRIIFLGGDCDSLEVMEASDTNLRSARELLAAMETKP